MNKKNRSSRTMAMGGIFAALAVTIMAMGTIIPIATYVCPVICMFLLQLVSNSFETRIAWSWYGAVAILSLLLAPDKEAAVVFCFVGFYPIIKPRLDKRTLKWIWKAAFFNTMVFAAYYLMLRLLGIEQVVEDLSEAGHVMTILLLAMANLTFFLLDRLLGTKFRGLSVR